jgi:hypothetical protein
MLRMRMPDRTLADRLGRQIRGSSSRTYWLSVLVIAALGVALALLWPVRRARPLLVQPSVPRPHFRVVKVTDTSTNRVERLSLAVLVRPGMPRETLEAALNWALFLVLDEYNRQRKQRVRTVWAYAVDDSTVPLSRWRAMAIWSDPSPCSRHIPAVMRSGSGRSSTISLILFFPTSLSGGSHEMCCQGRRGRPGLSGGGLLRLRRV